jgi:RNA polymerase subunit RPABC4/transcription elongation factor Spt4
MQELECYNCGAINNFGNKFCTSCGEKFQYSCPNCNAIVNPGAKFCSTCAAELSWNIAPQSTPLDTSWERPCESPLPDERPFPEDIPPQDNTRTEIDDQPFERAPKKFDKEEERPTGPRRNIIPFIVIVAVLLFFILGIFVADIFLKF